MVDWLLKGEPREVQLEALRRSYYGYSLYNNVQEARAKGHSRDGSLEPHKGWGHFLQMRLGKTAVMLNEFELFRRDYDYRNAVILTPNKYKLDWPLEADRFGLSVPGFAYSSDDLSSAIGWVNRNRGGYLLSINYEALGYEKNLRFLEDIIGPDTYFAADESVKLKNPDGGFFKGAMPLAKLAGVTRIASGKPVTQGPHDLWAQLRFIQQLDGLNFYAFRNTFCKMGGFQGKQIKGPKNEERLQEILSECSWTARKSDWMKVRGVDYMERRLTLAPEQERVYNQMQEDFLTELENGTIVSADQIVTKLMKLQQITSGFIIDETGKTHDIIEPSKNPKIQDVQEVLSQEIDGKLLVFCFHKRSMDLLFEALKAYEPAVIRGGMSDEEIQSEKQRFNSDPDCRVLIGQTTSTKYGHTITGNQGVPCYTEYFFENTYSLDDRSQLEERAWAEWQEEPLTVMDPIASRHDLAPIRALQRKEDVASLLLKYDRSTGILPPKPEGPAA